MIKSLISLRGIFILFIFLHHAGVYPGGGSVGVVFFFVLSGFSMTIGYRNRVLQPSFDYKQYLTRRAIKFYPLHLITLLANIPLTLMSTLHWWLIPVFFVNAALLQSFVPIYSVYFSFNAVSWFLADILFFALIFPFIIRKIVVMSKKQRALLMFVWLILYAIIAGISIHLSEGVMKGIIYINPFVRLFDFVFGILLGLNFMAIKERNITLPIYKLGGALFITIVTIIALLVVESTILSDKITLIAPLYWPLIAVLILITALPDKINVLENKLLICLGEYSFTIFLVHRLVVRYTKTLLSIDNRFIYVLFCLTVTIILSVLVDKYILKPITQWLTKRNQPSMTARS